MSSTSLLMHRRRRTGASGTHRRWRRCSRNGSSDLRLCVGERAPFLIRITHELLELAARTSRAGPRSLPGSPAQPSLALHSRRETNFAAKRRSHTACATSSLCCKIRRFSPQITPVANSRRIGPRTTRSSRPSKKPPSRAPPGPFLH